MKGLLELVRAAAKPVIEMVRVIRYGQALRSVAHYEADIERSKIGLAKAFAARDQARADLDCFAVEKDSEPPAFLRVQSTSPMVPDEQQTPQGAVPIRASKPRLVDVKRRRAPRVCGETS